MNTVGCPLPPGRRHHLRRCPATSERTFDAVWLYDSDEAVAPLRYTRLTRAAEPMTTEQTIVAVVRKQL